MKKGIEIRVDNRIAEVTKMYNSNVCQLKFKDNSEIINVFYLLDEKWSFTT